MHLKKRKTYLSTKKRMKKMKCCKCPRKILWYNTRFLVLTFCIYQVFLREKKLNLTSGDMAYIRR